MAGRDQYKAKDGFRFGYLQTHGQFKKRIDRGYDSTAPLLALQTLQLLQISATIGVDA
jgi:hypothetical protein